MPPRRRPAAPAAHRGRETPPPPSTPAGAASGVAAAVPWGPPPGVRREMVDVPTARLSLLRAGWPGARPVLLIMGFGMGAIGWIPQLVRLAEGYDAVSWNHPGIGASVAHTPPGLPVTMAAFADQAAGVLDALGWPDAHVVGVSMGGMIAQHLAARHRGRVRSLTLIATHPGPSWRYLPRREGLELFLKANKGPKDRVEALEALLIPPSVRARGITLGPDKEALRVPAERAARLAQLRAIVRHDARPFLAGLAGLPTLVIAPEQDILVPARGGSDLAARLPGATLARWPEGGHGVTGHDADALTAALRAHFDGVDATASPSPGRQPAEAS